MFVALFMALSLVVCHSIVTLSLIVGRYVGRMRCECDDFFSSFFMSYMCRVNTMIVVNDILYFYHKNVVVFIMYEDISGNYVKSKGHWSRLHTVVCIYLFYYSNLYNCLEMSLKPCIWIIFFCWCHKLATKRTSYKITQSHLVTCQLWVFRIGLYYHMLMVYILQMIAFKKNQDI